MTLGVELTNNVLVNIVVGEGVVKGRVSVLSSQRARLRRQALRILVLKGLPVGKGEQRERETGVKVAAIRLLVPW